MVERPSAGGELIRHVVISGYVQGVGFRYWTEQMALRHGLEGFVRNLRDGSVEAVFSGPESAVDAMLAACRQGPAGAAVASVENVDGGPELLAQRRRGERFSVLPTV